MLLHPLWLASVLLSRRGAHHPSDTIVGADERRVAPRAWRHALTQVRLLQLVGLGRRLERERARRRAAG